MKTAHVNIPVFIPHLGCPNMCVFCNQRAISGVCSFIPELAQNTIETVLSTVEGSDKTCEIAFFGGSFTGIDRELMISLLELAESYVKSGKVSGIRMSTRPDYINDEIIEILHRYTISAVELGIQSFDDKVLTCSKRGHKAEQSRIAMTKLKNAGFTTVGQMMIGLPGATIETEIECAEKIVELGASATRIYPTVVFRDTELCDMTQRGEYVPLTLDEAVRRSAAVLDVFERNNVTTLRIGLCESENLHGEETYFAGPNHPSLGEMVYSELYYNRIVEKLAEMPDVSGKNLIVEVSNGEISKAVGQKKRNKERIQTNFHIHNIKFIENKSLKRYNIVLSFL